MILLAIALMIIVALIYFLRYQRALIRYGVPLLAILVALILFFILQNIIYPYDEHTPIRASEQNQQLEEKNRNSRMRSRERQPQRGEIEAVN
ncbi:hypothetical protein [Ignatzschineria cameli]|uniref:Uncharacterized protein n=1 Tax=Ignatzschineria cameli TaxID=2182793 RepID=A0A2U2ARB1_9GAMM|nr:hypothetical protein [Ignatzschineria cameli]PWD86415.1 hypothetical protein DC077_06685 [Ignatzschineria cameli]PWD89748.1 hypothetical protein DC079_05245 [Ignatzschineria cameli]PWD91398.1 hypothetical protein DC081_04955 [Ignatzschineria cameli]PWD92436.1 hypothetical protein DC078_05240 [Ignatzschineria cameli]